MREENTGDLNQKDPKIYEIGYLLVPFVAETEKGDLVRTEIISVIEKSGGQVVSELPPLMKHLAYPIRKMIANKYSLFRDAYFGAVKFEIIPAGAVAVDTALRKKESVIRFLLLEAPNRNELTARMPTAPRAASSSSPRKTSEAAPVVVTDEKAIDKQIDDLLVAQA